MMRKISNKKVAFSPKRRLTIGLDDVKKYVDIEYQVNEWTYLDRYKTKLKNTV